MTILSCPIVSLDAGGTEHRCYRTCVGGTCPKHGIVKNELALYNKTGETTARAALWEAEIVEVPGADQELEDEAGFSLPKS